MIRRIYKRIAPHTLQPAIKCYLSKPRSYRHAGMQLRVLPGVFHPGFFISTKLLVEFLSQKDLAGKSFLELGCGAGMVSVFAAQQGAIVTASDIHPIAVENVQLNAVTNGVMVQTVVSDLFDGLSNVPFDIVVINPPYYPRNPASDAERAWFCGEGFEYFHRLFAQLRNRSDREIYMILSEDCDVDRIMKIAEQNGFGHQCVFRKRKRGEENYIFKLERL